MYRENSPIYLLCAELVFIILIFISAIINILSVRFKGWNVPEEMVAGDVGGNTFIKCKFSKSILGLPAKGKIVFRISNQLINQKEKITVPFYISGRKNVISFPILLECAGKTDISIVGYRIFDVTGLIGFYKKLKEEKKSISVTPKIYPIHVENNMGRVTNGVSSSVDDEVFYNDHPGDDPSEIYDFRDFRVGDKLSHVNWKMTAKERKMIVKEMSDPVREPISIVWGAKNNIPVISNACLTEIYSLALALFDKEVPFSIVTKNETVNEYEISHVMNNDGLKTALNAVLNNKPLTSDELKLIISDEEHPLRNDTIIYITTSLDDIELQEIMKTDTAERIVVWLSIEEDYYSDNDRVVVFHCDRLAEELRKQSFEIK